MAYIPKEQSISLCVAPENNPLLLLGVNDKRLALKLMEMGCMPGMQLEKLKTAVAKGPVMIKLHPFGNLLALRYEEAEQIMVECRL